MQMIDLNLPAQTTGRRRLPGLSIAAAVIAFAGLIALLLPGGVGEQMNVGQPRPALTVTLASPIRADWPVLVDASGVIAPWEEASVGTQIGSHQLIAVLVNVGDQVRRGQVLARLNPALLRAEEAQLVARDEQARANDKRARADFAGSAASASRRPCSSRRKPERQRRNSRRSDWSCAIPRSSRPTAA